MAGTNAVTTTQIDNASLTFIERMDQIRENEGVTNKIGKMLTLPSGYGLTAHLPYTGPLTAAPVVDGELFLNAQSFADTDVTITAVRYGVQTLISKFSSEQVNKVVDLFGQAGEKMAAAMAYKFDRVGITAYQGFGGLLGSNSTTLVVGHLDAAMTAIMTGLAQSGATARTGARDTGEPANSPLYCVLHPRQLRALRAQLSGLFSGSSDGSIGSTTPAMDRGTNRMGMTDLQNRWVLNHFVGKPVGMGNVTVLQDGNISVETGTAAAKGWIAERDAMVHLNYSKPLRADKETEDGLYRRLSLYDACGYGVVRDPGGYVLYSSAAAYTS